MYDIKSYYAAKSVQDAIRALSLDQTAELVSGGTDVLIRLREGKHPDCSLISIHRLPELNGIRMSDDGCIVIGSGTCFTDLERSEVVQKYLPALAKAAGVVGGPQIRGVGTIGGNICNGAVSADTAPILLALDAILEFEGVQGRRSVPIREFYTGPGKTVRAHDEILTCIRISPESYQGFGSEYIKFGKRKAMEIATLGCAANLRLNKSKDRIKELRLAFGVAAPTPIRCPQTEAAAEGKPLTEAILNNLGQIVLGEVRPRDSWRASKVFRLQLIRELTGRTIAGAITYAGGELLA